MSAVCVVLFSSVPSGAAVETSQRQLFDLLSGKGLLVEKVDGAAAANKELRGQLWAISNKRAICELLVALLSPRWQGEVCCQGIHFCYLRAPVDPQLFLRAPEGSYTFVGDWDQITVLNENNEEFHGLDKALAGASKA